MLTINADSHPMMSRMHRPDPKLPPDQQDKRSDVATEFEYVDLADGPPAGLVKPPFIHVLDGRPMS